MEGKPLGDKLFLMLATAVVNKLSDSLAVVIVKKLRYTGSYKKAEGWVEKAQNRPNRRSRHLLTHTRKVEGKVLVDTQGDKLKAIQLHILQLQWPMCKIDAHVFALAYKLEKNTLGNTLLKVEAELLVVTQVAMLAEVKVQTLARL